MIKKFENFNNEKLSREEKIKYIIDNNDTVQDIADVEDISSLNDEQLEKYYQNVLHNVEGMNESDGSTTAVAGSGTAVGGGAVGSYTSAMGTSVGGGDSGSAFASNSSISGMDPIISAQPSSTPGDVAGSTVGSGDIGQVLGVYGKSSASKRNRKKKSKRSKAINKFDSLYTTHYVQSTSGGKIIQSWKTFNGK